MSNEDVPRLSSEWRGLRASVPPCTDDVNCQWLQSLHDHHVAIYLETARQASQDLSQALEDVSQQIYIAHKISTVYQAAETF